MAIEDRNLGAGTRLVATYKKQAFVCTVEAGEDGKPVYVAAGAHERAMQRALLHYKAPANADLVREALIAAGREDLIGTGPRCLVRPGMPFSRQRPSYRRPQNRRS